MRVHQILKSKATSGVLTVASTAKVSDAAKVLADNRIGSVVVSDDDGQTAIGILSERDIVRELGRRGSACMADTVDSIMTARIIG